MTYEQNYLAHYGIKGQKWGVRRFQNEDRTLTEAGKERYRNGSSKDPDSAEKEGSALGKQDIQKYESMTAGPEKRKMATRMLSEMADSAKRHSERRSKAFLDGTLRDQEEADRRDLNLRKEEGRMNERASWLTEKISRESGDWYFNEPVTKGFEELNNKRKEAHDRMDARRKQIGWKKIAKDKEYLRLKKEHEDAEDRLMGQVLKDIGFDDTPENRKNIYRYVIWD